ncbi:MAG: histidinol-phosphate transaminase, partial [Alphaproteobacteria bacterium]|nr:histidinol-phosphate transaminase [Alphaproteobacteria bacterium]
LPRYIAGGHAAAGFDEPIVLSSNENPRGPTPKAISALEATSNNLHRYPASDPQELKAEIAAFYGLDTAIGEVILGRGSDEIISLLAKGFAHRDSAVLISQYGFLMYPIASKAAGAEVRYVPETDYRTDVDGFLAAADADTHMMFLANPNNPTGSYISKDEIARLVHGLPEHVLLVLDCAYSEYVRAPDYSDHHDLVATGRVAVMHTFSKVHGLAGLRLGWAFVPPVVADIYERLRSPFNITIPSIAAGIAALSDRAYLEDTVALNIIERKKLFHGLGGAGINVLPSVGNFLLLDFGSSEAANQAETILHGHGIIVRGMTGYGLGHCLRLSVGLSKENAAVLKALTDR